MRPTSSLPPVYIGVHPQWPHTLSWWSGAGSPGKLLNDYLADAPSAGTLVATQRYLAMFLFWVRPPESALAAACELVGLPTCMYCVLISAQTYKLPLEGQYKHYWMQFSLVWKQDYETAVFATEKVRLVHKTQDNVRLENDLPSSKRKC